MRAAIWLLLLLAPLTRSAEPSVSELMRRLEGAPVLRGDFAQSRQIVGFRRPVQSLGHFTVARGKGLIWHTTQPFESVLSASAERLRISYGPGSPEVALDVAKEPALRAVSAILQSIVVADLEALQSQFEIDPQPGDGPTWSVTLRPKEPGMRERFSTIEISGGSRVSSVVLREKSGDVTTIRLSGQSVDHQLTQFEAGMLR